MTWRLRSCCSASRLLLLSVHPVAIAFRLIERGHQQSGRRGLSLRESVEAPRVLCGGETSGNIEAEIAGAVTDTHMSLSIPSITSSPFFRFTSLQILPISPTSVQSTQRSTIRLKSLTLSFPTISVYCSPNSPESYLLPTVNLRQRFHGHCALQPQREPPTTPRPWPWTAQA